MTHIVHPAAFDPRLLPAMYSVADLLEALDLLEAHRNVRLASSIDGAGDITAHTVETCSSTAPSDLEEAFESVSVLTDIDYVDDDEASEDTDPDGEFPGQADRELPVRKPLSIPAGLPDFVDCTVSTDDPTMLDSILTAAGPAGPSHNMTNAQDDQGSAGPSTESDTEDNQGSAAPVGPIIPTIPTIPTYAATPSNNTPIAPPAFHAIPLEPLSHYLEPPADINDPGIRWYVVTVGSRVGIFSSWTVVSRFVSGKSGAVCSRASSFVTACQVFTEAYNTGYVRIIAP